MTPGRLAGKVAIVTGATGGIGRAIAGAFAAEGASLVLAGRRSEPAGLPDGALYAAGDVLDEDVARNLVVAASDAFGRLDVLVNCHGAQFDADIVDTSLQDARRVVETNVIGPLLTMKHAIPAMAAAGGGSIVNIASRLGIVGIAGQTVYSASKGGLIMLSKGAALELAPKGIRVNVVAPGLTATEGILAAYARRPDPDAVLRQRTSVIPLGRLATPEEVAAAVVYFASDESAYVTGAVLPVDGGYTAG